MIQRTFRRASLLALVVSSAMPTGIHAQSACCSADVMNTGLQIAARYRVEAIPVRRFTHAEFWNAVGPTVNSSALKTAPIGESMLGRPIRSVTFGQGPTRVLLWSQMHGDESTATMSLADIFRFLAEAGGRSAA